MKVVFNSEHFGTTGWCYSTTVSNIGTVTHTNTFSRYVYKIKIVLILSERKTIAKIPLIGHFERNTRKRHRRIFWNWLVVTFLTLNLYWTNINILSKSRFKFDKWYKKGKTKLQPPAPSPNAPQSLVSSRTTLKRNSCELNIEYNIFEFTLWFNKYAN